MAFGVDDAALLAGASILASGASQGLGALIDSGGSSANQQMRLWNKMYEPRDELGGLSRAQMEQAVELQGYKKSLDASSAANLAYNAKLPSAMRQGLESAGYNPMLAALGSYSSSSVSGTSFQSPSLNSVSKPNRSLSSALNASDIYKMVRGYFDTEQTNKEADTANKKVANKDIEASADLKHAEADLTRAKAETENKTRDAVYKEAELKSRYGDGITGSVGRYWETLGESLSNLFFTPEKNSAKPVEKPVLVVPAEPNSSKKSERYLDASRKMLKNRGSAIDYNGWLP